MDSVENQCTYLSIKANSRPHCFTNNFVLHSYMWAIYFQLFSGQKLDTRVIQEHNIHVVVISQEIDSTANQSNTGIDVKNSSRYWGGFNVRNVICNSFPWTGLPPSDFIFTGSLKISFLSLTCEAERWGGKFFY